MTAFDHLACGLLWLSFGLGHSLFADEGMKQRLMPHVGTKYRLLYNVISVLHIALVIFGGQAAFGEHAALFGWPQEFTIVFTAVQLAAIAILIAALTQYDLGRFVGLTQLKAVSDGRQASEDEPLHLTGLHRYVRHPLYAGAYLYLWSSVEDEFQLVTAIWGTAYLAVGTIFEERRLLRLYGSDYSDYRAFVPALVPWKGRAI